MAQSNSTIYNDNTMQVVERSLAFESALSLIESVCVGVVVAEHAGDFYDLSACDNDLRREVDECAAYLEWRGLLFRVPGSPDIVTVLDEDAADHPLDAREDGTE